MVEDLAKTAAALILFGIVVPLYGAFCVNRPALLRANLVAIVFGTSVQVTTWTLQIQSVETYPGHTRGFEINFLIALAVASLIGVAFSRGRRVRIFAPGVALWWLYVLASSISIVNALNPTYTLMAVFKFGTIIFIYIAVFNLIQEERDVRLIQTTLAVALIIEGLLCFKLRYFDGFYRIRGSFVHSNNLGMYAYMNGLYLLGALVHDRLGVKRSLFLAAAYLLGMTMALMTVSRASAGAAIGGTIAVLLVAFLMRPSFRKLAVAFGVLVPLSIAGAMAFDTVMQRVEANAHAAADEDFRWALEEQGRAMLADESLGIGWNNFCVANSRPLGKYSYILEDWTEKNVGFRPTFRQTFRNPLIENHYWLILGETGYLGLVTYLLIYVAFFSYTLRSLFRLRRVPIGAVPVALVVVFPILYMHGFLERIVTDTPVLTMMLIHAGTVARLSRSDVIPGRWGASEV